MRVLLVNTLYAPYVHGGAELSVRTLAEELAKAGDVVRVVTLGEEAQRTSVGGVEVSRLRIPNVYWPFDRKHHGPAAKAVWHSLDVYNPMARHHVLREIDDFKPDVVHTNNLSGFSAASVWGAARKAGVPLVHTLRDYYLLCVKGNMYRKGHPCDSQCTSCRSARWVTKVESDAVTGVVGISGYVLDVHMRAGYFSGARPEVIFNAVADKVESVDRVDARNDSTLRLGFLGRLSEDKGLVELLGALRRSRAQHWTLAVAGEGDAGYLEKARAAAAGMPVAFLGRQPASTFLKEIDVLMVPSLWAEPFARVIAEAFVEGKPVIGTSNGAIPELIDNDGNGFLYCADGNESLERILDLLSGEGVYRRLQLGANASAKNFLVSTMLSRYKDAYGRAIHG